MVAFSMIMVCCVALARLLMLRRLPPCRDGPKSLQVCCECPAVEPPEVAMASASVHGARRKGFLRRQKTLPKTHKVVRSLL